VFSVKNGLEAAVKNTDSYRLERKRTESLQL